MAPITFGEKLSKQRKQKNITQEELAELLQVSRQAISKWENGIAYPETDKLIRMSEIFNCSLDYLLKDTPEEPPTESPDPSADPSEPPPIGYGSTLVSAFFRKRTSERKLFGMPLWQVGRRAHAFLAIGLDARGVIAIGAKACGILSFGLLSIGLFSFGVFAVGLLAIGALAAGILSAGAISIGALCAGGIGIGLLSFGGIAIGEFSIGGLAIGRYLALGDHAQAMIALGDSKAVGSVFEKLGELSPSDIAAVEAELDTIVPGFLRWAAEFIKLLI